MLQFILFFLGLTLTRFIPMTIPGICEADKPLSFLESIVYDPFRDSDLNIFILCDVYEKAINICDKRCDFTPKCSICAEVTSNNYIWYDCPPEQLIVTRNILSFWNPIHKLEF